MQPYSRNAFPPSVTELPPDTAVTETFGFTPLSLALGGLLGLLGSTIGLAMHGFDGIEDAYLPGGCLLGLLLFGGWELYRRRNRTSLAFLGDEMAIYRKGQLAEVAHRNAVTIYRLSFLNTFRELMIFGVLGGMGLLGGLALLSDPAIGLCALGVGIGMSGAFASSIYARIGCRHFYVPRGRGSELVVFRRGAMERFGY